MLIGGPAGVGSSMLFAHLRHSGAGPSAVINTRAIISVAWVAGPPVATFIMGWFGNRAMLLAIAAVAVINIATTAMMIKARNAAGAATAAGSQQVPPASTAEEPPVGRLRVVLIVAAFILLQATNATAMTIMTVYVTETLKMDVMWAGIALGVAAALEVPALLLVSRLTSYSQLGLLATSCIAGIGYYLGLSVVTGPLMLLVLQLLNAWSFAGIAGVGLPLFQKMIPRPGLSTGLYMNTRRIGAIVSGPIIAAGSLTTIGQRGIFLTSATLTLLGLAIIITANRTNQAAPERAAEPIDVT
ncbi:MFS transporter [Arthrobacter bambusae]|uniref:MFS transporter n=1 Tax=Arthrobacter bambusae TaxID=1338426 RepID=UPI001F505086|nr:MFS transporter [Arthrobacter bambusae]MCI0143905.1 MFS transporter [Arthrobacter bambusae]